VEAEQAWETKRDLNKVWMDDKCTKYGFDRNNTLMIDSEARKVRDFMENSIVIKPYTQ
jgi:hypothetical protein